MAHLILITKGGWYTIALFSAIEPAIEKATELRSQRFSVFGPVEQTDAYVPEAGSPTLIVGHDEEIEVLISPLVHELARGIIEQQLDTDDYVSTAGVYEAAYRVCVMGLLDIGFPNDFAQKIADEEARKITHSWL